MLKMALILPTPNSTTSFGVPVANTSIKIISIDDLVRWNKRRIRDIRAGLVLIPDNITDKYRDYAYAMAELMMRHLPEDRRQVYFYTPMNALPKEVNQDE